MKDVTTAYPTSDMELLGTTPGNITEYNDTGNYKLAFLNYFTLVVYSFIFLLGTIGNGLVICFTIFRMKKTVNVIWFLNLSIADFAFTLFLLFSIIYLANGFIWIFGTFMCKMNTMMTFINMSASVFFLTVISIDRCISVIFPVWCRNHRTPRLASFIVLAIWILSIICGLPYFLFRDTHEDFYSIRCFKNLRGSEDTGWSRHNALVIMRFIVGFLIPFPIVVTCYSVIALRIHRNLLTTSPKPFKVIITVIICFFVCWFPYHLLSILELHTVDRANVFLIGIPLTSILAYLNSCVNPFLYVFFGRDFKDNFWRSIQSVFEKAFNEDP
ncbi:chemerin-like receptor 1 [Leptodactylus fuscus]|uniref:chemerin-like receptor 1 n=1 Tax=Leptodactylus fuscus TaxID=238119 RepID=UPI003F4EC561